MIKTKPPRLGPVPHEPCFEKVRETLRGGTAKKPPPADSIDFMRAVMPLLAGNSSYVIGTMDEQHGMNWVVPPSEPIEKAEEDRNRPPDAPTLRRPIKP